jgi:uncharacterized protein (DUF2141 family)
MSKRTNIRFHIIILIFLVIYSCAKIGSPSGGPRDREPPVVVKTIPAAGATGYSGYKVEITFNEYVALDNINDNLIVSPPSKKKPKTWIRGKTVVTEFEDDFADSTTYSLNFQDAIKDLNEGNVFEDYQFVFSTGPVLDSLSVTGNVYNADNLEVPEKLFVMMHRQLADSAVKKHLPEYITLTDKNGYFRINNVRPGKYRLYALKDADNNKFYNLEDEPFAFQAEPIEVTADSNWIPVVKDTTTVKKIVPVKGASKKGPQINPKDTIVLTGKTKLLLFIKPLTARYLTSSERKLKYKLEYTLSLPPDSMDFDFSIQDADSNAYLVEKSLQRDSMVVWLTDTALYNKGQLTTYLRYPVTDTAGVITYKNDTVMMRFVAPKPTKQTLSTVKKETALKLSNNVTGGSIKPGKLITFTSETPLRYPDTSLIKLYDITKKDTLVVPYVFEKNKITACIYTLNAMLLPNKKYFLEADSGAFSNYYNESTDSIGMKISLSPADTYGKLSFKIKNGSGKMLVQLFDKGEKQMIRELVVEADTIASFTLLEPVTYRARIVFDSNGDGKWTTGDFSKSRLPEEVTYYPKEIELKAKFEVEQDWDVAVRNFKDQKMRTVKSK